MTTAEEKEILSLLCKVHELEIDKVDMMMLVIMVVIVCLVRELEIDKMGWQIFKLSAEFRIPSIGPSRQKDICKKKDNPRFQN